MSGARKLVPLLYAAALLWVNAYICRDWLYSPTAHMNTLYGYWSAVARLHESWLQPSWWPFWDAGMPFEFTSPPLVPAMASVIAGLRNVSHLMAVQTVSAVFYLASPLALYLLGWILTRSAGYSFLAALAYSLVSTAQILAPDGSFSWSGLLSPHRFVLQAAWDETPRVAALTFSLLFLAVISAGRTRRATVAAALCLALAMLASPFALISCSIAVFCLAAAIDRKGRRATLLRAAAALALAYSLSARWLPPSLWASMAASSAAHEAWDLGALKYIAAAVVLGLILDRLLVGSDWRVRFLALWALAVTAAPFVLAWFHRLILPQAHRFRIELEAAVALAVVFGLRPWIAGLGKPVRAALLLVVLAFAAEQTVEHRRIAKDYLFPVDVKRSIEYRAAERAWRDFGYARVMLPGSIAHWANAFTDAQQFAGSEGTTAYSQIQQSKMTTVYESGPAEAVAALKAYGVAAVLVSGSESKEIWKPFHNPTVFDGILPALWTDSGVTAYRVPQRTASLAHVVPESAVGVLDRYVSALDDPSLPEAAGEWIGRNRMKVRATTAPGQAVSIQVSYHPGWHATSNGRAAELRRDALGLMYVRKTPGDSVIELNYDGGWELRLCRWIGVAGLAVAAWLLVGRGGRA